MKAGTLALKTGKPRIPRYLSQAQKKRISRSVALCELYFKDGMGVEEIAAKIGKTHQRVSQILNFGVNFLIDEGYIYVSIVPSEPEA
jgi:DNA-binding transcriptional regulator LsrR (DeoR family)